MSQDIIKFAFVGGEVSPNYYGRPDLEKFDLALAQAENWFVDYHGGLSTSPGLELVDFVQNDQYDTKFFTFKFSNTIANTNVILFGKDYIRFIQDGAYVLEGEQNISSITQANPGVVTIPSHSYAAGDWIKFPSTGEMTELVGRTCQVGVVTTNTFELLDPFGNNLDTTNFLAYVSGGSAARIYTIVSPYDTNDLELLRCHQIRDLLRFTHNDYVTYNLIRNDSADWDLEVELFVSNLTQPSTPVITALTAGFFFRAYVITQVDINGVESLPSDYGFSPGSDNDQGTIVTWTDVPGAVYYKIYGTRVLNAGSSSLSRSYQTGYLGQSRGSHFVDNGLITPDFTQTPPQGNNPFSNGRIKLVDVINGGSGYTNASILTVTDPNPNAGGFIGYLVIKTSVAAPGSGAIAGVLIIAGGHDYSNPSFTASVGTGAVFSAQLGDAAGNYPAVSTVHQQREVYAALLNKPLTFFGSRPGQLSNFNVSDILVANDSYEHEIDSEDASPIRHMIPTRGGLLIFNAAGLWLASGSGGTSITATNVQADPQAYKGASQVPPVKINTEILYCEGTGGKVMLLSYNDIAKLYAGVDLSLLASHLISKNNQIERWCYADEPFKTVWAQRQDGVMLNFTIIREQEVYAWSRRTTRGDFTDVISLEEESSSTVYTIVKRKINGRHTKFIEKVSSRDFDHVEDAFCVDCGLRLGSTYPAAGIQIAAITGDGVAIEASVGIFISGDVGKIIRAGGGKMRVATFVNASEITVDIIRDITKFVSFTNPSYPKMVNEGDWTMDSEVTVISGLSHLEGETVIVLADGNVVRDKVVTNGKITLSKAASRVIVGLSYRCLAQNLPLNVQNQVVENKRKRVMAIAMRLKDTRGLTAGNDLDTLYPVKPRTTEDYGEPNVVMNGMHTLPIEPIWNEEGQSYLVQDDPLPATVLGYVLEVEVGDDSN
jgi:hypothetical protein